MLRQGISGVCVSKADYADKYTQLPTKDVGGQTSIPGLCILARTPRQELPGLCGTANPRKAPSG